MPDPLSWRRTGRDLTADEWRVTYDRPSSRSLLYRDGVLWGRFEAVTHACNEAERQHRGVGPAPRKPNGGHVPRDLREGRRVQPAAVPAPEPAHPDVRPSWPTAEEFWP